MDHIRWRHALLYCTTSVVVIPHVAQRLGWARRIRVWGRTICLYPIAISASLPTHTVRLVRAAARCVSPRPWLFWSSNEELHLTGQRPLAGAHPRTRVHQPTVGGPITSLSLACRRRRYPCWGGLLPLQEELLCPELSGVQTPTCLPTSRLVPQSAAFATGLA